MTKVLGCKVEDNLYKLFDRLPGTKSENLQRAIVMYLNYQHNKPVNHVNSIENRRKHQQAIEYLNQLEKQAQYDSGGF